MKKENFTKCSFFDSQVKAQTFFSKLFSFSPFYRIIILDKIFRKELKNGKWN